MSARSGVVLGVLLAGLTGALVVHVRAGRAQDQATRSDSTTRGELAIVVTRTETQYLMEGSTVSSSTVSLDLRWRDTKKPAGTERTFERFRADGKALALEGTTAAADAPIPGELPPLLAVAPLGEGFIPRAIVARSLGKLVEGAAPREIETEAFLELLNTVKHVPPFERGELKLARVRTEVRGGERCAVIVAHGTASGCIGTGCGYGVVEDWTLWARADGTVVAAELEGVVGESMGCMPPATATSVAFKARYVRSSR